MAAAAAKWCCQKDWQACKTIQVCGRDVALKNILTKNYYNRMTFLHVTINYVRDLFGTQCIILQHRPTSTTFIFRSTEVGTYHHEPIEEAYVLFCIQTSDYKMPVVRDVKL